MLLNTDKPVLALPTLSVDPLDVDEDEVSILSCSAIYFLSQMLMWIRISRKEGNKRLCIGIDIPSQHIQQESSIVFL